MSSALSIGSEDETQGSLEISDIVKGYSYYTFLNMLAEYSFSA